MGVSLEKVESEKNNKCSQSLLSMAVICQTSDIRMNNQCETRAH